MKTKVCKACKEAIHAEATKCPKCQSFQSKFRNSSFWALLPMLFVFPFLMYFLNSTQRDHPKYIDYQEKISMKVLRIDTLKQEAPKNYDLLNILVELDNNTDIEWEQGEYEVEFRSPEGALLNLEKSGDFSLRLHPNTSAKSAIKVPLYQEYRLSTVKVNLTNLRHHWY